MPTEIENLCNTIEECYEFTLSYAAQGLPSDQGSGSGKQLREHLAKAVKALAGLEGACAADLVNEGLTPAAKFNAFFVILTRDASAALAAIELVLSQPSISSQLIDNLNASIHLRALLTDLFLITELLALRERHSVTLPAS